MTKEETIWYLEPIANSASLVRYKEALELAISALREQQLRENPEPLTLDELRQMDGESVWLKDGRCFIVNTEHPKGPVGIEKHGMATSLDLLAEIGLYRHKPKEEPK